MELIVTHRHADFDALAAQIAASKLFPDALRVTAGGLPPTVKKFYTLHRDHFELTPVEKVDQARVRRLIVVDVNSRSRLKDFKPLLDRIDKGDPTLEVRVYDHHAVTPDSLGGEGVTIEQVGAATTLLVEEVQKRGCSVTPIEATAMALGIYGDTGFLTFTSTTVRDLEAAAFCIRNGAGMSSLGYFLHAPLGPKQLKIFSSLMSDVNTVDVNSIRVGTSAVMLDTSIPGLSELVNQALMLLGHDAFFAFFERGHHTTVIGRSRIPTVDLGEILQKIGGGGHHGAGAATLKNTSIRQAKTKLMTVLQTYPPNPYYIRYAMSSPVFTLSPAQILSDVSTDLTNRGYSGAPVVHEGKLVGVLSKRDIRSAKEGGRDHLTVASCMSTVVEIIGPDRSLRRALEQMAARGVGRLPVVHDDHLVGLITRNDVLRVLYGHQESLPTQRSQNAAPG